MKVTASLILTPLYNYDGDRIIGAQISGVRQNPPATLRDGARSVRVVLDIANPETFFGGQIVDLGTVEEEHTIGVGDDPVTVEAGR